MRVLLCTPRATVIHGTWQDAVAAGLTADVTITDPPYTDHVHNNIRSCSTSGPLRVRVWEPDFEPLSDYALVPALAGATTRWSLMFCALEQFAPYLEAAGGWRRDGGAYVRSAIWRKKQAAPALHGRAPANSCEGIAILHTPRPGATRWNGRGKHAWYDVGELPEEQPDAVDNVAIFGRERASKIHVAQKPSPLCEHLISLYSEPGELVADWFCGSGAISAAALKLGRRTLAVECDEQWAEYTADRLRDEL